MTDTTHGRLDTSEKTASAHVDLEAGTPAKGATAAQQQRPNKKRCGWVLLAGLLVAIAIGATLGIASAVTHAKGGPRAEAGEDSPPNHTLLQASKRGNVEAVRAALSAGADVNVMDNDWGRRTSLMLASSWPEDSLGMGVAEVLLAHGADVDTKDTAGETALMHASYNGRAGVAKTLLAKGADVNVKDEREWTSLMNAAYTGRVDVTKLLLAKGADVHATDKHGNTALAWARKQEKTWKDKEAMAEVVALLEAAACQERCAVWAARARNCVNMCRQGLL